MAMSYAEFTSLSRFYMSEKGGSRVELWSDSVHGRFSVTVLLRAIRKSMKDEDFENPI